MGELRAAGVQIELRPGQLAYSPSPGRAGRILLDPDVSIGALRHEFRHFLDLRARGYPSMAYFFTDIAAFWLLEFRAYMEELRLARQLREFGIARSLVQQMRARREQIRDFGA